MSCDRRCFDATSAWHNHEDCATCAGKDDGAPRIVKVYREQNWKPHAENRDAYLGAAPGVRGTLPLADGSVLREGEDYDRTRGVKEVPDAG